MKTLSVLCTFLCLLLSTSPARSINCLVRNLSETGAAIEVPNESGIPAQFELRIVRLGLIMLCRVVRRKDYRIGVAFVRTAPGDGSTV